MHITALRQALWFSVLKSVKIEVKFSMSEKRVKRTEYERDGGRQQGRPAWAKGPEKVRFNGSDA
jgi:hypothetical protein